LSRLAIVGGGAGVFGAVFAGDPVSTGLLMLAGGAVLILGLRRVLLGSLGHETRFTPGLVVRAELGSQSPRVERQMPASELRCLGLATLKAGALGSEQRLVLVQKDRGLLPLCREPGTGEELRQLAAELSAASGLPLEEVEGWPTHEWRQSGVGK
jgi:hypothetical protein